MSPSAPLLTGGRGARTSRESTRHTRNDDMSKGTDIKKETKKKPTKTMKEKKAEKKSKKESKGSMA
jgi:hypothetical protein